jgi:hypothetical protein
MSAVARRLRANLDRMRSLLSHRFSPVRRAASSGRGKDGHSVVIEHLRNLRSIARDQLIEHYSALVVSLANPDRDFELEA